MEERRGRPKLIENIEKPSLQFIRTYEDDGIKETWTYDLDKFPNGPIAVEITYPRGYQNPTQRQEKLNEKLPKSKQRFLNPANGKEVGYQRAKELGLIK